MRYDCGFDLDYAYTFTKSGVWDMSPSRGDLVRVSLYIGIYPKFFSLCVVWFLLVLLVVWRTMLCRKQHQADQSDCTVPAGAQLANYPVASWELRFAAIYPGMVLSM